MAASILALDLKDFIQADPTPGRVEDAYAVDTNNVLIKHRRLCFPIGTSVANPEAVCEFILPTTYGGATGFTLVFQYTVDLNVVAGAVVWEISAQRCRSANADSVINADSWGTPTVASADTVPTVAGEFKKVTIALVKANVGGAATPLAGDLVRFRIRRLNTTANATDTCLATVFIIGSPDLQDT